MSGPELDREFKALLAAVRPLLPTAPQAALASTVRWLQKLSSLPPSQRCQRNRHMRLLHGQLATGAIAMPFDTEPPAGLLSALPACVADKQTLKAFSEHKPCNPKPAAGDASPRSDAKGLIEEARAMLRTRQGDSLRHKATWRAEDVNATVQTTNAESNDDEWSDISTSDGGETCATGDLTLVAKTGHERCILLHRKHMLQLANQSACIRRYETALKHFLDNPALLLGDQASAQAVQAAQAVETAQAAASALQRQLDSAKSQLLEAEREKAESQHLTKEAHQKLQACQKLIKTDSANFTKQLAALNGKLQSYQQQMRAKEDAAAKDLATVNSELAAANRELATVNGELKTCQLRLRADAESFRKQLATLNGEMEALEEENKIQLAARDKKTRLQLTVLREEAQRESEDKLAAAKKKITRLHKVIRRYDELKQRWSEEFEKKINRLQIEKDLQMAKVRLEVQAERASFPLTSSADQLVAELEVKYQALARQHEETSWRQRQRDLRRISELERELEARSMHTDA